MDTNPIALIVEDEYDISLIFAKALRAAGFEAEIVHSGGQALEWLASNVPHIVVLDLQMPKVAGTEVLEHIRADPRLADVMELCLSCKACKSECPTGVDMARLKYE